MPKLADRQIELSPIGVDVATQSIRFGVVFVEFNGF
jgi:hypothetical protein